MLKSSENQNEHTSLLEEWSPSAKFETIISEPRPKQKKKTVKTVQSGSRFTLFRLKYIKIISVSIWIL